jgi:hypothetical protein
MQFVDLESKSHKKYNKNKKIKGLHRTVCQLINEWPSRSNWNLGMLIFAEGGKPENPEKNPQRESTTNSTHI